MKEAKKRLKLDFQTIRNANQVGRYTTTERGLQLLISKAGQKYWVHRYCFAGKRHDLALGSFPDVSIAEVRKKLQEVRYKLNQGINPLHEKRAAKVCLPEKNEIGITFKEFAVETIRKKQVEWSNEKHIAQWENTLKDYAYPVIGNMQLNEIEMEHILTILTPIWETKTETASRLRGRLEWVLAAATTKRLRSGINPAAWRGLLQTILPAPKKFQKVRHHKALPYRALPEFMAMQDRAMPYGV